MLLRAFAILLALVALTLGLSVYFGAEILIALGLMAGQAKVVWAKLLSMKAKTLLVWLKAQGINFARIEVFKRWITRSLVPLIIGASLQRRISALVTGYLEVARDRYTAFMSWYRDLPLAVRVVGLLIAMTATVALALTTAGLWLILFSVQLPVWIIAGLAAIWQGLWRSLQKMAFRTIAFMQLYRVWDWLRGRLPQTYLQRLRRFNFRVARIVVRRRRMTVRELHLQKDGLAMRLALLREYFRHTRPAQPSAEEFADARARRRASEEAGAP